MGMHITMAQYMPYLTYLYAWLAVEMCDTPHTEALINRYSTEM